LLKLFSNGFEISILVISNDFALTLVVEKKNKIKDRIEKKIYKDLIKCILNLNLIVMNKNPFTYKKSGVNIDAADKFVNFIANISSKNKGNKKFNNIGGFGSISNIPKNIKNPKIVACTDGVGTKIEIANFLDKYNTIGIDLVAMSVNDLIVQGARPLFFLDYVSINKIDLKKLKSIIRGIVKGCDISQCSLVGGETAEMPGTYEKGKFDIAGFAVGVVDEKKILNKRKIKKNDLILAVPSSGLHSNGFSLVRHLLKKKKINIKKNNFLKKELIRPTKIYVKEVLEIIDKKLLNGCANITGGGLGDNIKRIIPDRLCADIDLSKINPLKIFKWLKKNKIDDNEMLKTFNCGVGFCLIINPKNLNKINKYFTKEYKPYVIGKIINGNQKVKLNDKIQWSK
jgi:phosphoribosylaminoimidazole synthetase